MDPRIRQLEPENAELLRALEILKTASALFARADLDRRLCCFADIDPVPGPFRVEPICRLLNEHYVPITFSLLHELIGQHLARISRLI